MKHILAWFKNFPAMWQRNADRCRWGFHSFEVMYQNEGSTVHYCKRCRSLDLK